MGARLAALMLAVGIATSACGSSHTATQSSPSGPVAAATASATVSPLLSPGEVPQGRAATPAEVDAMVRVSKRPAEAYLHLGDWDSCPAHPPPSCMYFGDATGFIGIKSGFVKAGEGCPSGCGGASCWVYLFEDASGWHFVNAACAQGPGSIPSAQDLVRVNGGGCANVRSEPGKNSRIVGCLPDQTTVDVDSAPVYTDGKIWWHLKGKGWMAHDFLIESPPNA
ncbi:MAG: SH3 domain-containing protein [Candidatus Dormibacteraeota bacterium]|nr:SH3 domain-containing protein [Candidatus Dormibacteraeota bacterium]